MLLVPQMWRKGINSDSGEDSVNYQGSFLFTRAIGKNLGLVVEWVSLGTILYLCANRAPDCVPFFSLYSKVQGEDQNRTLS